MSFRNKGSEMVGRKIEQGREVDDSKFLGSEIFEYRDTSMPTNEENESVIVKTNYKLGNKKISRTIFIIGLLYLVCSLMSFVVYNKGVLNFISTAIMGVIFIVYSKLFKNIVISESLPMKNFKAIGGSYLLNNKLGNFFLSTNNHTILIIYSIVISVIHLLSLLFPVCSIAYPAMAFFVIFFRLYNFLMDDLSDDIFMIVVSSVSISTVNIFISLISGAHPSPILSGFSLLMFFLSGIMFSSEINQEED